MAKYAKVLILDFVQAWEESQSVKEVADKTGLKITSIMAKASKYRGAPFNIPLKAMARKGAAKVDVTAARELIAQLRGVTVEAVTAEATQYAEKQATRAAAK